MAAQRLSERYRTLWLSRLTRAVVLLYRSTFCKTLGIIHLATDEVQASDSTAGTGQDDADERRSLGSGARDDHGTAARIQRALARRRGRAAQHDPVGEAFGWADRERRVVATPHTLYSLASISKPITATALMVLVERGVVDLDRPIDDYLGTATLTAHLGDARDATVRRIANHTVRLAHALPVLLRRRALSAPTDG